MNSIIVEDIFGRDRNLISAAYYAFSKATKPVTYSYPGNQQIATYDSSSKQNKWIYSCWFRRNETTKDESANIKISLQTKDTEYWYFNISSKMSLSYAEMVTLYRGS